MPRNNSYSASQHSLLDLLGENVRKFQLFWHKLLTETTNKCPVKVWEQTTARKDEHWCLL